MRIDRRATVKDKLVEAARRGQPLTCSKLSPGQLASCNDGQQVLPAEVIRDLLRSGEKLDPRGVRVVGARITEALDLNGVDCKVGLTLRGCWFDQPMTVRRAKLPWLSLDDSHLPALVADQLQVAGNVNLDRLHVRGHGEDGAVRLRVASIGGHLLCHRAQLANDTGPALNAEGLQVKGNVYLRDGFCAIGHGADGAVRLRNVSIGGALNCSGAQMSNQAGSALHAARLQVDGTVLLNNLVAAGHGEDGTVRLRSARIGGRLFCRGAQLTNPSGPALHAARLESDGSVHFEDLRANGHGGDGAVRLWGASIGDDLFCRGAQLNNQSGPALSAAHLQVEGSVHFEDLRANGHGEDGTVRLRVASIGGSLFCRGAQLSNDAGPALSAREMQVRQAALLGDRFRATGHGVRGAVRLRGARIGTSLEFGPGVLNPDGPALDLRSASVTYLSLPREAINCSTQGDSRRQVTDERLLLDGLTYSTIPRDADIDQWLHWLRHCTRYKAQPYQQLASVHRAVGEEAKARRILVAQQNALRASGHLGGRWARARHWLLGLTIGYGYRTWRAFVGLAVVLVLAIGLGLLAGQIHGDDRWVAAHIDGTACSIVEQVGLGVERAIPLLISNLRVGDRCILDSRSVPGQLITAAGWTLQLAAWALATLAIVGYTGLVRKT